MRKVILALILSGIAFGQKIDWHDLEGKDVEVKTEYLIKKKWVRTSEGWHRKHHHEHLTLDEAFAKQDAKDTPICRWCIEDDMQGSRLTKR